ncbi:uncharacterized protein LOC123492053 isoform X1 [Coregonus clupeaformis]|uniref:uncharacterized protein LOC123492053 isoform X1 n=1 Tax=Coregonus clupeaformis TaxID=59861 RepID=UPI001E1C7BEC|nr:uncharacterized protein LOC123492053 isoform X1 [Coregonus clupeaformis]XP_045079890.1 uncharacterized protein LOC123492053 isoform X1 [Coregonus clupeaformis]XP_045079891.1 uncharacterized protein LOC123492053 isoform X1 [Coregonus clupeaformis]
MAMDPGTVCCPHLLQDVHHCSCTQESKGLSAPPLSSCRNLSVTPGSLTSHWTAAYCLSSCSSSACWWCCSFSTSTSKILCGCTLTVILQVSELPSDGLPPHCDAGQETGVDYNVTGLLETQPRIRTSMSLSTPRSRRTLPRANGCKRLMPQRWSVRKRLQLGTSQEAPSQTTLPSPCRRHLLLAEEEHTESPVERGCFQSADRQGRTSPLAVPTAAIQPAASGVRPTSREKLPSLARNTELLFQRPTTRWGRHVKNPGWEGGKRDSMMQLPMEMVT